jgi:hypothetical protein
MQQVFNILCQIQKLLREVSLKIMDEYKESDTSVVPVSNTQTIPQVLAQRNDRRREVWIYNDSDFDLFISPLTQAETDKDTFSLRIAPRDTLVMNATNYSQAYKKKVYGFWEDGAPISSRAMITEFSMKQ